MSMKHAIVIERRDVKIAAFWFLVVAIASLLATMFFGTFIVGISEGYFLDGNPPITALEVHRMSLLFVGSYVACLSAGFLLLGVEAYNRKVF